MNYNVPKLIAQYAGALTIVGLGIFLLLKHHPLAGGLIIAFGLGAYSGANGKTDRGRR
jgi:hypothetical protein